MSQEQQPGRQQAKPCLAMWRGDPNLRQGAVTGRKQIIQNLARPGAEAGGGPMALRLRCV